MGTRKTTGEKECRGGKVGSPGPALRWFAERGWTAHPFQMRAWEAYAAGRDGLVNAPTGMGKTLSVWLGPVMEGLAERGEPGLKVLYITPLRALATDIHHALVEACEGLGSKWRVEQRTGDTASSRRRRQRERPPDALVTTPESCSLLLSYPETAAQMGSLRCVVVDEWHELMGGKRGVLLELALARLRGLATGMRTWGMSATLGNLDEAMRVLTGARAKAPVLIRGPDEKAIDVRTVLPEDIERFPWAGHLGIRLLPRVIEAIEQAETSLVFTNTRSQTEIWYQSIIRARPDLIGQIALHHGSLDRKLRTWVENKLREGGLRAVVCTSSLDLGVDFAPVDQVIQVGSPKGIGRLLQRAGRSGHRPGAVSRLVCVPTNALELLEFGAARGAMRAQEIEARPATRLALDVLLQHVVGTGVGAGEAGFDADALLAEARSTHAFAELSDEEWSWVLDSARCGGPALVAYPQYARITGTTGAEGRVRWRIASAALARAYRQSAGTIMADTAMIVRMGSGLGGGGGKSLGTIEEGFIARLAPGDTFSFAGRVVQLVRVREMTAFVRPAKRKSGRVPSWQGARMPLSTRLAAAVRARLDEAEQGRFEGPELACVAPLLLLQRKWSALPGTGVLVIESTTTREGHHLFVYPLEGRLVHEGLAALCAYRLARGEPRTFTMASGDHGFNLATPEPITLDEGAWRAALSTERLVEDLRACLNAAELARRQFREVARIAGLVNNGLPGERRSTRHVQASSELFFDVLSEHDPGNLLLAQAQREVLERQLELSRMRSALERIAGCELRLVRSERLTPFAFPLWADSLREQLSTERWTDRVQRMLARLEQAAGADGAPEVEPVAAGKRSGRRRARARQG
ncbi:MAG: ligase-associated DNA damage response DEXH box helicase [Phycisphaerales bacterium]